MGLRIAIQAFLSPVFLSSLSEARQSSPNGLWAPGYDHPINWMMAWPTRFEAINMAVIPLVGTGGPLNPGKVIAFDSNAGSTALGTSAPWPQRFAVGAPETGVFDNYIVFLPTGFGDIFCSGHVWMPDGKLFVAGGTTQYPTTSTGTTSYFIGSKFVGIWDPAQAPVAPYYGWTFVCDPAGQNKPLHFERWYPTVTFLGSDQDKIMVAGGVVDTDSIHNFCGTPASFDGAIDTYEIWDIAANDWIRTGGAGSPNVVYNGPEHASPYLGTCFSMFGEYPRQHLISDGTLFVVGMYSGANHMHPTNQGVWLQDRPGSVPINTGQFRSYGASVLVPNVGRKPAAEDRVWIIGGSDGVNTTNSVQTINGFTGAAWNAAPSMNVARMVANTVLLPDGAILEIGGCTGGDYFSTSAVPPFVGPPALPEYRPEIYRKSVAAWVLQNPQASERMYHSTAALLPSGNVVSAGGDIRTCDWEVFTPDYLSMGQARPAFTNTLPTPLSFDTLYPITFAPMSPGLTVDRVVLMRPCSVAHHSDMDQRYVELEEPAGVPPPNTIFVKTPPIPTNGTTQGSVVAPRGWYMMFLISNTGVPSIAQWVQLL